MTGVTATKLDRAVDVGRDHILGNDGADITLVEYGSYACPHCHAVQEVIANLRDRFGQRMRYVFRHRPIPGNQDAERAAELVEYVSLADGRFWELGRGDVRHRADVPQPPEGTLLPGGQGAVLDVLRHGGGRHDAVATRAAGGLCGPAGLPWDNDHDS
jgi:hypothetical protein